MSGSRMVSLLGLGPVLVWVAAARCPNQNFFFRLQYDSFLRLIAGTKCDTDGGRSAVVDHPGLFERLYDVSTWPRSYVQASDPASTSHPSHHLSNKKEQALVPLRVLI